jgi:ribosome-binding factor A
MTDVARARRLAVRIREIVADTLERQVKDPRLGMVTITDARVTPDLREATVFYTVYGDESARAETAAALDSARGVLRSQVGRQTGVRFTPTLTFVADMVPAQARQIEELLDRARHADAEVRRVREGATFAGDPEPYRSTDAADRDTEPETEDAAGLEADRTDGAGGENDRPRS